MKHSFIALCTFAAAFTATFVACSKKDLLPNDQKMDRPGRTILASRQDTPYGNKNNAAVLPSIKEPGIKILPTAKGDTPYSKIIIPLPVTDEHGIKIIAAAKGDTPYSKIIIPLPVIDEPGIKIIPAAKGDTPYSRVRTTVIKPLE